MTVNQAERLSQDKYQYEYNHTGSTAKSASTSSTPYTSPSTSTDTSPASAYSEQLDRPAYPAHADPYTHPHPHFHSHSQPQLIRQYYPSSPYEKYNREHSYFGPLLSATAASLGVPPSRPHSLSNRGTTSTTTSNASRLQLTWTNLVHFLRPKLRIRQRKMPLSRRGRTCFCVVLPLLAGTLLFLSTFPVQVPWATGTDVGGGLSESGSGGSSGTGWRSSKWGVWEEGSAGRDWLSAVLGKGAGGQEVVESVPTALWSYIPSVPSADPDSDPSIEEADPWAWLDAHRAEGRRASWGGLSGIGASEYIRDNLREDRGYVTAFPVAGFNNQVMDIMNTIHLAIASHRIPILASFKPDIYHLIGAALPLSVGSVFDLSALARSIDVPVVEAHELRIEERRAEERMRYMTYDGEPGVRTTSANGTELKMGDRVRNVEAKGDEIGCWSVGMMYGGMAGTWGGLDPLKIHWTPTGLSAFPIINSLPAYDHWSLPSIARIINSPPSSPSTLPSDVTARLAAQAWPTPALVPENQLACLESTYWLVEDAEGSDLHDEWRNGRGTWDKVGRYMRFQPGLRRMAEDYAREMFGVGWGEEVPPYMAIHMRRGDFDPFWKNITPRQWAYRASQIMDEAKAMGIEASRVLVTTDETDEAYLEPFRQMGWTLADHAKTRTGERLGYWFPTLIDGILLAQAKVFMGIPSSTMSILALRRVMDWEGGHGGWADPYITVPEDWEWSW